TNRRPGSLDRPRPPTKLTTAGLISGAVWFLFCSVRSNAHIELSGARCGTFRRRCGGNPALVAGPGGNRASSPAWRQPSLVAGMAATPPSSPALAATRPHHLGSLALLPVSE